MSQSASTSSLVGQIIAERYQVIRQIGAGGMGAIYEVMHLRLNRTFAMKVLTAQAAQSAETMARFQREADIVATLRHRNVVEVVDIERLPDGSPCMVMELLRGGDLGTRLRLEGPMSWPAIARIADQILSALAATHRNEITHRDLKPQNIFLALDDSGEEIAKLLDFGVSKIRSAEALTITHDDRIVGTPSFMSPEQADGRGDEVGPHTDVWAMGAILYEMATGRRAFNGSSTPQILYRICYGEPEPLELLRPDAPAGFIEVVSRALSRDATKRLTDVPTMRGLLRKALADVAPDAITPPTGEHERAIPPAVAPRARASSRKPESVDSRKPLFVAVGLLSAAAIGIGLWLALAPASAQVTATTMNAQAAVASAPTALEAPVVAAPPSTVAAPATSAAAAPAIAAIPDRKKPAVKSVRKSALTDAHPHEPAASPEPIAQTDKSTPPTTTQKFIRSLE